MNNQLIEQVSQLNILANQVVNLLIKENKKIATAESCTGGIISSLITSVSGSSQVFDIGLCTYANSAKEKLIGVSSSTLEKYGAVSSQTAFEMAKGVMTLAEADFGISVTGIAGPTGGTKQKPVGTVFLSCTNNVKTKLLHIIVKPPSLLNESDIRSYIRFETAKQALILINDFLIESKSQHKKG
ncbi:MAG: CinA family protein [Clostridiales bacterium]|nr:CinA family protein [Clostridiales bacterium]